MADRVLALTDMASNVEVERALAAITATINDQQMDQFDRDRVQEIVTEALGGQPLLSVDDGGGLHDQSGARVGVIRRTPSGEWITERQNETAERSDTAVPTPPPQSKLRKVLTKLKVLSG
jgi:hypothetical protein